MEDGEPRYSTPHRYEPPSFTLMMELLRMLGTNGAITVTITISAEHARVVAE